MEEFKTITQYDKTFDTFFENQKDKGYACSYFSILTVLRFLEGHENNMYIHEKNIFDAMTLTSLLNLNSGLSFEDLISGCTSCDCKKITATCVDLITNDIIGKKEMFPELENNKKYAVLFLKNEKYFVVMVDSNGYYLRDCHTDTQKNFNMLDDMFNYLCENYQFTQMIDIDGFIIDEYSSIEFFIFNDIFETEITQLLEPIVKNDFIVEQNVEEIHTNKTTSQNENELLEQLNEELDYKFNLNKQKKYTDEEILFSELQKEFDEFDNNQYIQSLLIDSVSPDDMNDYEN